MSKQLKLERRELTDRTYEVFGLVYGKATEVTPQLHTEFAEILEVDRQVAKEICFQIMFTSAFFVGQRKIEREFLTGVKSND